MAAARASRAGRTLDGIPSRANAPARGGAAAPRGADAAPADAAHDEAAYLIWSASGWRNSEKPVSMICTPMHSSRNADTRFATLVPSVPR